MKIKMLATVPASLDGINSELFRMGEERDLPDNAAGADLARNLISGGLAEEVRAKPETKPAEGDSKPTSKPKPEKKAAEA